MKWVKCTVGLPDSTNIETVNHLKSTLYKIQSYLWLMSHCCHLLDCWRHIDIVLLLQTDGGLYRPQHGYRLRSWIPGRLASSLSIYRPKSSICMHDHGSGLFSAFPKRVSSKRRLYNYLLLSHLRKPGYYILHNSIIFFFFLGGGGWCVMRDRGSEKTSKIKYIL